MQICGNYYSLVFEEGKKQAFIDKRSSGVDTLGLARLFLSQHLMIHVAVLTTVYWHLPVAGQYLCCTLSEMNCCVALII